MLDAPTDRRLLDALLLQQNAESGGFHTHYRWDQPRLADPNVETTSMALLALHELGQRPRQSEMDPIGWAVAYLRRQYDPAVGLLRESVTVAPHHFWLATDNRLAVDALRAAGADDLAQRLAASVDRYGGTRHGVIEALAGAEVASWPPLLETHSVVTATQSLAEIDEPCHDHDAITAPIVCNETRLEGRQYGDWKEYADWLLYGALVASQQGPITDDGGTYDAHDLYEKALEFFNGTGFADKAFTDPESRSYKHYATYKLALALIVADRIAEPMDERVLAALLDKQAPSGGFYTLYDTDGVPGNLDTNTETTSYALLALRAFERGDLYLPAVER